jgi:branched-chain amino acid transport system permease protein
MSKEQRQIAVVRYLRRRARWRPYEYLFWLVALTLALIPYLQFLPDNPLFHYLRLIPDKSLILTEIAIIALFALSLDLILGYAGIISLGHAAYFGFGGYVAGLLAKHGIVTEPVLALLVSGAAATLLGFVTSFLVLRGSDLTRLMVTLGVALVLRELANRFDWITGGADGLQGVNVEPVLGLFPFDLYGHTGYAYSLIVLFILFLVARRIVYSPFGLSLRSIKGNPLRSAAIGIPVNARLIAIYTIAAGFAGVAGALLTQTTQFVSLEVFSIDRSADLLLVLIIGGIGHLYGGLIGAVVYKFLQDWLANLTPQYWQFWIGLVLVMMVLFGRIYGGIIAALVFGLAYWLDLTSMKSFIVTTLVVLALGLARPLLMQVKSQVEKAAVGLIRNMWTAAKPIPETPDHAGSA